MLPSKGYFTNIRCLFYDASSCDRPYCHFRHTKKGSLQNEDKECLITAAKRLEEKIGPIENFDKIVVNILDEIHNSNNIDINDTSNTATYNPTPLNQLKSHNEDDSTAKFRRHIPIQHPPYRPPVRSVKTVTSSLVKKFNSPSSGDSELDETVEKFQYVPTSTTKTNESESSTSSTYIPVSIDSNHTVCSNYVPTVVDSNKKELASDRGKFQQYVPESGNQTDNVKYHPTDINTIAKSDYDLKTLKYSPQHDQNSSSAASNHVYNPTTKISTDSTTTTTIATNNLTDLVEEFDFINEILNDVEKDEEEYLKTISKHDDTTDTKNKSPTIPTTTTDSKSKHSSSQSKSTKEKKNHSISNKHHESSSKKDSSSKSSSSKSHSSSSKSSKHSSSSSTSKKETKDTKDTKHHDKKDKEKKNHEKSKKESEKSISKKESSDKHSSKHHESNKHHETSSSSHKSHKSSSSKHSSSHSSSKSSSSRKSSSSHKSSSHHHSSKTSSSNDASSKSKSMEKSTSKQSPLSNGSSNTLITPDDYLSSDDDIEEQCRKIFEDESIVSLPSVPKIEKRPIEEQSDYEPPTKKRIAHASTENPVIPKIPPKPARPNFIAASSKMLVERYKISQKMQSNMSVLGNTNVAESIRTAAEKVTAKPQMIRPVNTQLLYAQPPAGKVRIAHVPNVSGLINAKNKITQQPPQNAVKKTVPQTVPKGQSRVMHVPSKEVADRPTVKEPDNTKIPLHVRSVILNNMIDACLDMYAYAESAYERARNEEYMVFVKCRSLTVYKHSAKLAVHRLQTQAKQGITEGIDEPCTSSKLEPAAARRHSTSESNMYAQLTKYILTPEQLWEHGYPRPHPTISANGAATINITNKTLAPKDEFTKTCARCHKNYRITKHGYPEYPEECIYHYKKRYRLRGETRYGCCGSSDDIGCTSAPMHVFDDIDPDNLRGFVETMDLNDDSPEEDNSNRDYGVYALDCEMSYTTAGIELTRITVIDRKCQVVYETIVKPFNKIIDYNTRFSGIGPEHLEGVTTTLLDVQANLLHMFNSKTILIGHSLESDLKALKLIHNTVIDTSIMFPHRLGPPYKRALKNLAFDYLSKIIQNQVSGHDSAEDAITCMELVLWKINEDSKVNS